MSKSAPTVVITEFMDDAAVASLSSAHATVYDPGLVDAPEKLGSLLAEARVLIVRNRTQVRPDLLDKAPKLEFVGRLGVGLDNIDLDACKARGIHVQPATGANSDSVAEYVIAAMLMLARSAYQSSTDVVSGTWPRNKLIGGEVGGKTLGLVGFGGIAQEVARRAEALDMTITAYDPFVPADSPLWQKAKPVSLDELFAESDFISLHVPLVDATRHLISADAISKMKPTASVINTARGGVVDDKALAAALRDGKLGGAALDVFETEPMTAESGSIFESLDNVILTPHIAGVTEESNVRVSTMIADKALAHLAG